MSQRNMFIFDQCVNKVINGVDGVGISGLEKNLFLIIVKKIVDFLYTKKSRFFIDVSIEYTDDKYQHASRAVDELMTLLYNKKLMQRHYTISYSTYAGRFWFESRMPRCFFPRVYI